MTFQFNMNPDSLETLFKHSNYVLNECMWRDYPLASYACSASIDFRNEASDVANVVVRIFINDSNGFSIEQRWG